MMSAVRMNMTTKMIASATAAMTIVAMMVTTAAMTIIVQIIKYEKTNDVCIDAYHQLWCISSEKNGNR